MRVIPIEARGAEAASCSEEVGPVPKIDLPLARREFLQGSGILMGTLAAGSVLAVLAPSRVWALELKSLSDKEGQTLMAMGRTLFPHKKLPDAVYAILVKDLDGKADALPVLREGIASLDRDCGGPGAFVKAAPARRLLAVQAIEGRPFFNTVRGQCVTSLYDNDMAFAVFGYEGACFEKGGYIHRGFQDLKWLAAPSAEASPAPFAA
jgi:hypothetical protein